MDAISPGLVSAASDATLLLDAPTVLSAAADPVRLALLKELARDGSDLPVMHLAARVGRSPDLVAKHLRILREARMIRPVTRPGTDGRRLHHEIPSPFLREDAAGRPLLDFGAVLLRF